MREIAYQPVGARTLLVHAFEPPTARFGPTLPSGNSPATLSPHGPRLHPPCRAPERRVAAAPAPCADRLEGPELCGFHSRISPPRSARGLLHSELERYRATFRPNSVKATVPWTLAGFRCEGLTPIRR